MVVKSTVCKFLKPSQYFIFYLSYLIEAIWVGATFDILRIVGLLLITFSVIMFYTVTSLLRNIWTVKLMIAKNHKYVDHWLFQTIKHPNYFLNIAPELIGIALLCHAKYSAYILLPLYSIVIYLRIRQENQLIKTLILPNGTQNKE